MSVVAEKLTLLTTAPTFTNIEHRFNWCIDFASAAEFIAPTYSTFLASVQPMLPKFPNVLQVNAPTYAIFLASVQPVYSTDLTFSESVAPVSTISLSSV